MVEASYANLGRREPLLVQTYRDPTEITRIEPMTDSTRQTTYAVYVREGVGERYIGFVTARQLAAVLWPTVRQ